MRHGLALFIGPDSLSFLLLPSPSLVQAWTRALAFFHGPDCVSFIPLPPPYRGTGMSAMRSTTGASINLSGSQVSGAEWCGVRRCGSVTLGYLQHLEGSQVCFNRL